MKNEIIIKNCIQYHKNIKTEVITKEHDYF